MAVGGQTEAVPRRAAEAAAARPGRHPDAHGRGPRRLAELPEPSRAQPAAGDRPGAAAAGRDLRPGPEDRSSVTPRAPAPRAWARSSPTRCSATWAWRATRLPRWPRTRRASPRRSCGSTAPISTSASLADLGAYAGRRRVPIAAGSMTPSDWVRDFIQAQKNYFGELEDAAERAGRASWAPSPGLRRRRARAAGRSSTASRCGWCRWTCCRKRCAASTITASGSSCPRC